MEALREMAHQIILSYAKDAERAGKHHVAGTEYKVAELALIGAIDDGGTIQQLLRNLMGSDK